MRVYSTEMEDAQPGHGAERIVNIRLPTRSVLVLVDGAGGVAGGTAAAETVCKAAFAYDDWHKMSGWPRWLAHADRVMTRSRVGPAAVVAIEIADDGFITGASVGDCEAWAFFSSTKYYTPTSTSLRRPLGAFLNMSMAPLLRGVPPIADIALQIRQILYESSPGFGFVHNCL
jgi:hypothetical protein